MLQLPKSVPSHPGIGSESGTKPNSKSRIYPERGTRSATEAGFGAGRHALQNLYFFRFGCGTSPLYFYDLIVFIDFERGRFELNNTFFVFFYRI